MSASQQNLPTTLTPLIGRDAEIRAVIAQILDRRLVTLAGPPGIGKTRLALQVAIDISDRYAERVWFVDLAPVSDPSLVPRALAATLGVGEEPGRSISETLGDHLAGWHALVVLDNCEHVIRGAANLADELVRRCGRISILATSREPLGIVGETTLRVPPLDVPTLDMPGNACAAVELFCERARAVQPDFELIESITPAVGEICRQLDGIALAIELAAARVDALSATQIAERLNDRFHLLTTGSRTALPRHQTLRAALDWSYDLLSEQERLLLRRLSVFVGGWTVEAAEDVCSGDGLEQGEILDLLALLVAKSMVLSEVVGDRPRYRLLETIRHYGLDRLHEADEGFALQARHASWCIWLAEQCRDLHGPQQHSRLEQLDAEHDNVRTALEWTVAHGHPEMALRIAAPMAMFWGIRGYLTEGHRWLGAVLDMRGGERSPLRAEALWGAGFILSLRSDFVAARQLLQQSLSLAQQTKNTVCRARSLFTLGICALFIAEEGPTEAVGLFQRGIPLAREAGDAWSLVCALAGVAWVRNLQGDPHSARSLLQECLDVARQAQDSTGLATSINLLGAVALRQGDLVTAEVVLSEAATLAGTLGDVRLMSESVTLLGQVALRQGDLDRASSMFEEALGLARRIGFRSGSVDSFCSLGEVARRRRDWVSARSYFAEALSTAWQLGGTCSAAVLGLGQVSLGMGDSWAAEALLQRALSEASHPEDRAGALHELAQLSRLRGDVDGAAAFHREAFDLWSELRDPLGVARSLEGLAGLAAVGGAASRAIQLFGTAHALREGTDIPRAMDEDGRRYDSDMETAKDALSADEFGAAWALGRSLSPEESLSRLTTGLVPARRAATGWDSLTKAERAVAALVAESLTNREIGERLYISPRTVQTHLSHIFGKLNIPSRRDLARLVARRSPSLAAAPFQIH